LHDGKPLSFKTTLLLTLLGSEDPDNFTDLQRFLFFIFYNLVLIFLLKKGLYQPLYFKNSLSQLKLWDIAGFSPLSTADQSEVLLKL
jgi:hypothetical protein